MVKSPKMIKKMFNKRNTIVLMSICAVGFIMCGCNKDNSDVGMVDEETSTIVDSSSDDLSLQETLESVENTSEADDVVLEENETEAVETEEETEPEEVSVIMVGDVLLHTPVEESALREDGSYDFNFIFKNMKEDISKADVAIVNQEVIIGGEELGVSGYPRFNAPYAIGDALVNAGFDIICHGTNHALDKGGAGIENCTGFWGENYPEITVLGINDSKEKQDSVYIYEQDGIRIAVLNYTYSTNGNDMPAGMPFAVDMLDKEKVIADIAYAEENADFTIVCPHWGTEYNLGIDASQERWTKIFLENGVDLVIGTHPHVIEPVEWMTDEENGHKMLVYYSLGNFVNWTSESGEGIANRMVGGMARVTIGRAEDGEACITDYDVEALVCHLEDGLEGISTYALSDYSEALAENNAIRRQDGVFSKEYCVNLCNNVWGDLWK